MEKLVQPKFVLQSVEEVNEHNIVKKIEKAFRVCYKSEDKMKEGSETLVTRFLANRNPDRHTSPAEHAWIKVYSDPFSMNFLFCEIQKKYPFEFSNIRYDVTDGCLIGNIRAFLNFLILSSDEKDGKWTYEDDSVYRLARILHNKYPELFTEPVYTGAKFLKYYQNALNSITLDEMDKLAIVEEYEDYKTFHIITSRDMLQELARHRVFSFSVESTRYVNYNNKGITFIVPTPYTTLPEFELKVAEFVKSGKLDYSSFDSVYASQCYTSAYLYSTLVSSGNVKPQQARSVLPGALKTELYMTGTISQWKQFLVLRDSDAAHPQMRELARQISHYIS